jgi:acyl-CoA thioester hydrolase
LTEPTTYTSRAIGWDDRASCRLTRPASTSSSAGATVYHELLEEGRGALFEQLGALDGGFFFVLARVELDHRQEIRRDHGPITVALRVEAVGRSSVSVAHEIIRADGAVAAEGRSVLVAWDRDARRSRPLTDAERSALG